MKELDICVDKANFVDDSLIFEPVLAGEDTVCVVHLKNKILQTLSYNLVFSGDINKTFHGDIVGGGSDKFSLVIGVPKNVVKPLKAKLVVGLNYIIG